MRLDRLLAPLCAVALAACSAPRVDALARTTWLSASGRFGASSGAIAGENDLGLGRDDFAPGLRVDVELGVPRLVGSVIDANSEGASTLSSAVQMNGTTIPAGTPVESDLALTQAEALVLFDLVPTSMVDLALGFGAALLDFDQSVRSGGQEVHAAETLPLPLVAGQAALRLGELELQGLVSGIAYASGSDELSYWSADLFARWAFASGGPLRASLALGWRALDLDLEYASKGTSYALDERLDGPWIGFEVSF